MLARSRVLARVTVRASSGVDQRSTVTPLQRHTQAIDALRLGVCGTTHSLISRRTYAVSDEDVARPCRHRSPTRCLHQRDRTSDAWRLRRWCLNRHWPLSLNLFRPAADANCAAVGRLHPLWGKLTRPQYPKGLTPGLLYGGCIQAHGERAHSRSLSHAWTSAPPHVDHFVRRIQRASIDTRRFSRSLAASVREPRGGIAPAQD
jgi:hypothetical protein